MESQNDIGGTLDHGKDLLVLFLYMSAAFDVVDAGILTELYHAFSPVEWKGEPYPGSCHMYDSLISAS